MRKQPFSRHRTHLRRESRQILPRQVTSPLILWNLFLRRVAWLTKTLCASLVLFGLLWITTKGIGKVFLDGERFRLTEINIVPEPTDQQFLNYRTIPEVTGLKPGESLFSYNLGELTQTLQARPEVIKAAVDRRFPGTLTLQITERVPVARVSLPPTDYLIDTEGYVYTSPLCPPALREQLPLLVCPKDEPFFDPESSLLTHRELTRALALLQTIQTLHLDIPIRSLQLSKECSIEATLQSGTIVRFGLYDHPRQARDLALILDHAASTQRHLKSVNLLPLKNIPVVFHEPSLPPKTPKRKKIPVKHHDLNLILGQG